MARASEMWRWKKNSQAPLNHAKKWKKDRVSLQGENVEDQKPFKDVAETLNDVKLLSRSAACVSCDVMLADQTGAEFSFETSWPSSGIFSPSSVYNAVGQLVQSIVIDIHFLSQSLQSLQAGTNI